MFLLKTKFYFFLLLFPLIAFSSWEDIPFKEDSTHQYWVGFSDFESSEVSSYKNAIEMATSELSKYNFGFIREEVETNHSTLSKKELFQESVSKMKNVVLKGISVSEKKVVKKNGLFKTYVKVSYNKKDLEFEKKRLVNDGDLEQKHFYDKKNYNFLITSNVENAQFSLINKENGESFSSVTGNSINFPSGKYLLVLEKNGYETLKKEIILSPSNLRIYLPLSKSDIEYSMIIHPSDSNVFLDNKKINPNSFKLDSFNKNLDEIIELKITKEEYIPYTKKITLRYLKENILKIDLIPNNESLSFVSEPSGAYIYLDGELIGETPLLGFNTHKKNFQINVIKKNHKVVSKQIKNNKNKLFSFKLDQI